MRPMSAPTNFAAPVSESGGPRPGAADRGAWRAILADVAVVTVTPFSGDRLEIVDHDGMERNLDRLVAGGVRLLVAGGNTGEFAALSEAELVDTVRTHARVARGRGRVLAGVG